MIQTARRLRDEDGFSLLEVMIAAVILGAGMLAVALAQLSSIRIASSSQRQSQAVYLAQEQIERFQALPATSAVFTAAGTFEDPDGTVTVDPEEAAGDDMTSYTRNWLIEPNTPSQGLTRITVNVVWANAGAQVETTTLTWIKGE
jgi:prepilin-type N-terminal cleavage/methylation domain-containing protein